MKKHKTFKGLFLPLIAVAMSFAFSSCTDDAILESVNSRYAEFTVTNDMWYVDANQEFRCDFEWDAISDHLLKYGTVEAYIYKGNRQVPLPYVYPVEFTVGGSTVYQPINIRFDIEKGIISFVISDLGDLISNQASLLTMRFRAVATVPVQYIVQE